MVADPSHLPPLTTEGIVVSKHSEFAAAAAPVPSIALQSEAPTLPHPDVPRRPPGNVLEAPAPAVTDRLERAAASGPVATSGASSAIRGAALGLVAGLAGVAAMTLSEKVEQHFTGRPNSDVPARTLQKLTGLRARSEATNLMANHVMHWGTGMLLGTVRAAMSARGMRGVVPSVAFGALRLTVDQTLENATGVGSPPHTWPRAELALDVGHKLIYALVTGLVTDRRIRPGQSA